MAVGDLRLPCGCTVEADHDSGERGVVCGGHESNVVGAEGCKGGRGYIVTARTITTVELTVRPMPAHMLPQRAAS